MNNKKLVHVLVFLSLLFLSLVGYLTYFQLFESSRVIKSTYNQRNTEYERNTERGSIYDRNGILLAGNRDSKEGRERYYPYGAAYSQVIGYCSPIYGKWLLEASYNDTLLDIQRNDVFGDLRNKQQTEERKGNSLTLTLDHTLQTLGAKLMGSRNGAIVAVEPATGKILALVSKPDFNTNPAELAAQWQQMTESTQSPFVSRAMAGLYAPGSTFKVITAAAALKNGLDNITMADSGSVVIDGKRFSNAGSKAYGNLNMEKALMVSSNTFFAQLGVRVGGTQLLDQMERVGFNQPIPFDINVKQSRYDTKAMGKTDIASAAIGQGKVLVTPLHMALITAAIANQGVMMRPMLVQQVLSPEGGTKQVFKPESLYSAMDAGTAESLTHMMQKVVEDGTGRKAAIHGVAVAGKTGTAQNEQSIKSKGKEHAWFIGFAPAEAPKIAVAVILEYSGSSGGTAAAPVAGQLMAQYLQK